MWCSCRACKCKNYFTQSWQYCKRIWDSQRKLLFTFVWCSKLHGSGGATLKQLFPRLFHITCVAHLLHNCAMQIRSFYSEIDTLIACIKASTVWNKERKALFKEIGTSCDTLGKLAWCCILLCRQFSKCKKHCWEFCRCWNYCSKS